MGCYSIKSRTRKYVEIQENKRYGFLLFGRNLSNKLID